MARARKDGELVRRLLARLKPKAKSLIITVYGDSVLHRGGCAWLGSIIKLTAPMGLNERVVRTSMFRLVKEGWLTAEPVGRRSYYRLTEIGRHRCDAAHDRIYFRSAEPWDRRWTFVATNLPGLAAEQRDALRSDLRWLGFGQLAPGVMLHPEPDEAAMRQAIHDADAQRRALVMRAVAEDWVTPEALRDAIDASWDLKRVAAGYLDFLDAFRPVWRAFKDARDLDPEICFIIRTLVMHAYRRVLLRDPKLPDELLDAEWPGMAAQRLCRDLYKRVAGPAERHLSALLETAEGPAPEAHPSYLTRFGGLRPPGEAA
jgi:phenylacetic acid degradation operon negative regulatory protein